MTTLDPPFDSTIPTAGAAAGAPDAAPEPAVGPLPGSGGEGRPRDGEVGHVVVLSGGLSHERDVSLRSGRRLADALRSHGVDVSEIDATSDLVARLRREPDPVVISALHGTSGEDGSVAAVLELLGLPFVGSSAAACRTTWDKALAKQVVSESVGFRDAGGVIAPSVVLTQAAVRDLGARSLLQEAVQRLGLPLVVKPVHGGSSLGVTVVTDVADIPTALVTAFAYDDEVMLEPRVVGTELAVSVIDVPRPASGPAPRALPVVEIVPDGGVYDYSARYTAGLTEFFVPARLSESALADIANVAVAAHVALGLRDVSRVDLILDAAGRVTFLEANVSPGLTETSLLPLAAGGSGDSLGQVYATLVRLARRRQP